MPSQSKTSTTSVIGIMLVLTNTILIFSIIHMPLNRESETIKIQGLTIASNLLTGVIGYYFGNSKKDSDNGDKQDRV